MQWVNFLVNSKGRGFVYCVNNQDDLWCMAAGPFPQLWLVYTSET